MTADIHSVKPEQNADYEREEWQALVNEPRLDMLPPEALIASIRDLAQRLLDITATPNDRSGAP